jgi:hypothetical protein
MLRAFPLSFGLLAVVLILTGCVPATTAYIKRPVDDFGPPVQVNADALEAEYGRVDGVFLDREKTTEHVAGGAYAGGWTYWEYLRLRYVVLNPEADWLTTQTITVRPGGTLDGASMRTIAPDGTVRQFAPSDFVVEEGSGGTTYKLAYPNVERGTVIEERTRVKYASSYEFRPPFQYDEPFQFGVPAKRVQYRFAYPAAWEIEVKDTAQGVVPDYSLTQTEDGKKTILEYTVTDVPALPDEPYAPFFKETADYLEFHISRIEIAGMVSNAPDTWEAVADNYKRYATKRGGLFSSPIRKAVDQSGVQNYSAASDKLERVVTWIQDEFEIGAASRDDLTTVVNERTGNPYLLTGLAQGMLREIGVKADFLLIHTAADGYFDEGYVSSSQLYMPAVGVPVGDQMVIAFPWIEGLPATHVPEPFQGQRALRIGPNGYAGFTTVAVGAADQSATDERYTVEITPDGVLQVEEERTMRGMAAFGVRSALHDLTDDERDEAIGEMLTYTDGTVRDLAYTLEHEDQIDRPLVLRLTYAIDDLVTVTPEEVLFQTGGLFSPASRISSAVVVEERKAPIRIYFDEETDKEITVRYPESWTLTTDLADVRVENDFGQITGTYAMEPGRFTATQQLTLRAADAPKEDFSKLLSLLGRQTDLEIPTLIFSTPLP